MAEPKAKKKHFVKIVAPRQFNEQIIGESLVSDTRALLGKKMKINMMSLTNDPKSQNIQVKLNINALKGENVSTELIGYTLLPSFVKRLVRKDKIRIDDCFKVTTKDGKTVVIKPFLLTLNKTTKPVATALRKALQKSLKAKIAEMSYDALIAEVVSHKLQAILKKELSKIYPLRQCEVRDLKLVVEKTYGVEKKEETPKVEEPKKDVETKVSKTPTEVEKKAEEVKPVEKKAEPAKEEKSKEEVKEKEVPKEEPKAEETKE